MRRLGPLLAIAWLGACQRDTAIVVEVSWGETVDPRNDTLRIYVGTPLEETKLLRSDPAFAEETFGTVASPYRHLLEPAGALDDIGPLQIVAAVTRDQPEKPLSFGAYDDLVEFGDGEVRTVPIALSPATDFAESGDGRRCIGWDLDGEPHAIGNRDDADCDTVGDGEDCAPFDATLATKLGDPELCDGTDQACDGALVADLPCVPAGGPPCSIGIRTCGERDDSQPRGYSACTAILDATVPGIGPGACLRLPRVDACLGDPDPLACVRDNPDPPLGRCTVGARKDDPRCPAPDLIRHPLLLPAKVSGCVVDLFGGTLHAEWEVGFVSDQGPPLPPASHLEDCNATLAARAFHDQATPRTVMITASYLLEGDVREQRTMFVTLVQGAACSEATCNGVSVLP